VEKQSAYRVLVHRSEDGVPLLLRLSRGSGRPLAGPWAFSAPARGCSLNFEPKR
jgi:hypothetical protein